MTKVLVKIIDCSSVTQSVIGGMMSTYTPAGFELAPRKSARLSCMTLCSHKVVGIGEHTVRNF